MLFVIVCLGSPFLFITRFTDHKVRG